MELCWALRGLVRRGRVRCVGTFVRRASVVSCTSSFFFFNDTATTEIYTLSYTTLFRSENMILQVAKTYELLANFEKSAMYYEQFADRKSTRLNSSHYNISYAVFCLT